MQNVNKQFYFFKEIHPHWRAYSGQWWPVGRVAFQKQYRHSWLKLTVIIIIINSNIIKLTYYQYCSIVNLETDL